MMTRHVASRLTVLSFLAFAAAALTALAQGEQPAPAAGTTTPDATTAPSPTGDTTAPGASDSQEKDDREDNVTYDPQGRRDPFRPLTGEIAGDDERADLQAKGLLRGLLWTEVKLTTIVKTPKGSISTWEGGPKKQGYFAREGDKFWNAEVHSIDYDTATVVVREWLTDPKLLKPYRDHPISLNPLEQQGKPAGGGD